MSRQWMLNGDDDDEEHFEKEISFLKWGIIYKPFNVSNGIWKQKFS